MFKIFKRFLKTQKETQEVPELVDKAPTQQELKNAEELPKPEVYSIRPSLLEREEMTLDEFVEKVKSCLSERHGSGTLATDFQWFTNYTVTPYTGYVLNVSRGYKITGIDDPYTADTFVVNALREAGVKVVPAPCQSWYYYLKWEG